MNRRTFLQAASAVALPFSRAMGANDRIRVGFIGMGGRAKWLIGYNMPGTEIVAVADCHFPRCFEAAKVRPDAEKWTKYQDYRKMLDREKLDVVFVETTTHARVLIAMTALERGLDVYAEKPVSLTIAEGRTLANAVKKTNRVLQVGTQQRSMPYNMFASKLVRDGAIGKIHTVLACNFEPGKAWVPQEAQPVPEGLDWDLWCNQTELRPYHHDLQYKWSSWWDYDGGGQSWGVSGWGTHALDQVQAALGTDNTGPVEMWPEEPGEQARVTMRYASGTLLKIAGVARPDHSDLGAIFQGENGQIEIKRGISETNRPELFKDAPDPTVEGFGEDFYHLNNFFACVRSRKAPNATAETGHRATTVCHLVNITRQVGRKLKWDPVAEQFADDPQANKLLWRPRRKGYELPVLKA
ncbi:MAG: Gfo/Idh/MocA family oxidoreductase [Bryobacteraceae bacterium]